MFRFHDPTSPMPEAEIQVMVSGGNNIGRDLSRIGEEPTCTQLTSLSREALNLQKSAWIRETGGQLSSVFCVKVASGMSVTYLKVLGAFWFIYITGEESTQCPSPDRSSRNHYAA